MTPVDPATFRRLAGSFATGVTVLTLRDERDEPAGMTASAVASVSLEPPLLLVCVGKTASCHDQLLKAQRFALNVLADDQRELSDRFASETNDRFSGIAVSGAPDGPPLLEGAAAHIVCTRWKTVDAGDHTIFIGSVESGTAHEREPLLHFRGAYRRLY